MPDVRVLLVEPDPALRRATARALRDHFAITQAHDAVRALELIRVEERFDVVALSVDGPRLECLALLERLRVEASALARHCLVLSTDAPGLREVLHDRQVEVLEQPARIGALVEAVRRTAERS